MTEIKNLTKQDTQGKAFITDIPLDQIWINLVAQNLGINTLFTEPTEDMKLVEFSDIVDNVGGVCIGHPIFAKAIMFQRITKSTPLIYSHVVDNGISKEVVYLFKHWKWSPDSPTVSFWTNLLKEHTHDFPLEQWTKLHDMVMTRCLTTHVRDLFYHFLKMNQYGIFLTELYGVGSKPFEMLKDE
jgi:hypothetical protein